jgi:hypothetical protein
VGEEIGKWEGRDDSRGLRWDVGILDGGDVGDDIGYTAVAMMAASWELVLVPKLGCSLITQKVLTLGRWLASMLGLAKE